MFVTFAGIGMDDEAYVAPEHVFAVIANAGGSELTEIHAASGAIVYTRESRGAVVDKLNKVREPKRVHPNLDRA